MKIEDAENYLVRLRQKAEEGDYEAAHSLEDDLFRDVLIAIAEGKVRGQSARDLCAKALESGDIQFGRYAA